MLSQGVRAQKRVCAVGPRVCPWSASPRHSVRAWLDSMKASI